MTIQCKWRDGFQVNIKPAVAYREFQRIAKVNNGELPPSELVRQSKPKDAPLHNYFEWNNTKCGALWRQHQARRITRSLKIIEHTTEKKRDGEIVPVRVEVSCYTSVEKDNGERAYVNTRVGLTDRDIRRKILLSAHGRLKSAKKELSELGGMIDFIDDLERVVEKCGEFIKLYDAESDGESPAID